MNHDPHDSPPESPVTTQGDQNDTPFSDEFLLHYFPHIVADNVNTATKPFPSQRRKK